MLCTFLWWMGRILFSIFFWILQKKTTISHLTINIQILWSIQYRVRWHGSHRWICNSCPQIYSVVAGENTHDKLNYSTRKEFFKFDNAKLLVTEQWLTTRGRRHHKGQKRSEHQGPGWVGSDIRSPEVGTNGKQKRVGGEGILISQVRELHWQRQRGRKSQSTFKVK